MRHRKSRSEKLCGILACLLMTAALPAAEPAAEPMGSAKFYPSPERPIGWRGDGSGQYPGATPPLSWSRCGPLLSELRCQAAKPKDDAAGGEPIPMGIITNWLVLGPLTPKDPAHAVDEGFLPDEASVQPDAGEEAAGAKWREFKSENHFADFDAVFNQTIERVAYAHSYLYSPAAGKIWLQMRATFGPPSITKLKLWFNGKPIVNGFYGQLDLVKGWNRILLKIARTKATGVFYIKLNLRSAEPCAYASNNIEWEKPLPFSASTPIAVGEKLFIHVAPNYLCCINKLTGKTLWIRSNGEYDAATADEMKAHPEEFQAISNLSAQLTENIEKHLNYATAGDVPAELAEARVKLTRQLQVLMKKVDPARYKIVPEGEGGNAGLTPCSDGKNVYAWFANGVTVCYDLDGVRKWIRLDADESQEHGFGGSPRIVNGKLITQMLGWRAFNCETGKLEWAQRFYSGAELLYGSVAVAKVAGEDVIIPCSLDHVIRASDGKILYQQPNSGAWSATPVVENSIVYSAYKRGEFAVPATGEINFKVSNGFDVTAKQFPAMHMNVHIHTSSPVVRDGLLYIVDSEGDLTVADVATGNIVYQKKLDIDALFYYGGQTPTSGAGICASLAIAGNHLYVLGNRGVMLVLELGREYKLVAKNKIEETGQRHTWDSGLEITICTPVFDGDRMYVRGDQNLYCIRQK